MLDALGGGPPEMPRPAAERRDAPVFVVAHTHWDLAWHLSAAATRMVLIPAIRQLMDLLESDPHFTVFTFDGQVAPIDDFLRAPVDPREQERLRGLVRTGRIVIGPVYTQADQFLVSGETTLRNLQHGLRRSADLGAAVQTFYSPDPFGQIAQLPAVLALCGMNRAIVCRGVPADINSQVFRWEGLDGTAVVALQLLDGYDQTALTKDPAAAARAAAELRGRPHDHVGLIMSGGDNYLADPDLTQAVTASGARIVDFEEVWRHLPVTGDLPVVRGELRSAGRRELLSNVVSNHVDLRREVALGEQVLERYAEPLAAIALDPYPERILAHIWEQRLRVAAHDDVCATGSDATFMETMVRSHSARVEAEAVMEEALRALGGQMAVGGLYVWNPSPFERRGHVPVPQTSQVRRAEVVPPLGWGLVESRKSHNPVWNEAPPPLRITDERDVGDTYTFASGPIAGRRADISLRTDIPVLPEHRPGDPCTRLRIEWENSERNHRVRLLLTMPQPAPWCIADTAFGALRRPAVPAPTAGSDRLVGYPAGRFIVAGGLAVLLDRTAEFEILPESNELAITLLRATGYLSREALPTRDHRAGPVMPTTLTQVLGPIRWDIGVMRWNHEHLPWREWEMFALPVVVFDSPGGGDLPPVGTPFPSLPTGELSAVLPGLVRTFDSGPPWKIHQYALAPELPRLSASARQRVMLRYRTRR